MLVKMILYSLVVSILVSCATTENDNDSLSGIWKVTVNSNDVISTYNVGIKEESDYLVYDLFGSPFREAKFVENNGEYFHELSGATLKIVDNRNIELTISGNTLALTKVSSEDYFEAGSVHIESPDFAEIIASSDICANSQIVVGELPGSVLIVVPYLGDVATISINISDLTIGENTFDNSSIEINLDNLINNSHISIVSDSFIDQIGSTILMFLKGTVTIESLTQEFVKLQFDLESNDGRSITGIVSVRI